MSPLVPDSMLEILPVPPSASAVSERVAGTSAAGAVGGAGAVGAHARDVAVVACTAGMWARGGAAVAKTCWACRADAGCTGSACCAWIARGPTAVLILQCGSRWMSTLVLVDNGPMLELSVVDDFNASSSGRLGLVACNADAGTGPPLLLVYRRLARSSCPLRNVSRAAGGAG